MCGLLVRLVIGSVVKVIYVRSPNFIGIGAQKAGTTWLDEHLRRHPDVWMPWVKELQYFNHIWIPSHQKWTNRHRAAHGTRALNFLIKHGRVDEVPMVQRFIDGPVNDDWYRGIFASGGDAKVVGEITPEYSLLPENGVSHVKKIAPDAKIIFLMREPFERCWSHLRMLAKNSGHANSFDYLEAAQYSDVIDRCRYGDIIDRWSTYFDREAIFLGFQDDISFNPHRVMSSVLDFLDLEHSDRCFRDLETVVHKGQAQSPPEDVTRILKEKLRPVYEELRDRFPGHGNSWLKRRYP